MLLEPSPKPPHYGSEAAMEGADFRKVYTHKVEFVLD
jgi:hypothetical protein